MNKNNTIRLSEVANIIPGFAFKSEDFSDEGIKVIKIKDISPPIIDCKTADKVDLSNYNIDKLAKYQINKGDFVVAMTGATIGKVGKHITDEICYVNQRVAAIFPKKGHSKDYIYYSIQRQDFIDFILNRLDSSSAQGNISADGIGEYRIHKYSPIVQQKIAAVLSALDDKIELNNRINAELEQMARTLYDYWFVQFDFPNSAGKPYKSSGGKMVYNEVLKREIPEGWEMKVFSDWIKETKAGDWGKEIEEGNYTERVYCIRGADINGLNGKGEVNAPVRFIHKNNSFKILKPNDFIVEISGGSPTQSTARIALLTEEVFARFDSNVICSNFCKAVSLKNDKYAFNFLQEWQRLYDSDVFFGYEGKTSGLKNFLFDSFMSSYKVLYPPKDVIEKFYTFSKSIDQKRQINLLQNQQLASLRDWLLPMLMNGQVKVLEKLDAKMSMAAEPQSKYGI